jgi:hypothetical protein
MTDLMKQHASLRHAVTVTKYVYPRYMLHRTYLSFFCVDVEKQEMTTFIH